MRRRTYLTGLAGGLTGVTAGCLSFEDPDAASTGSTSETDAGSSATDQPTVTNVDDTAITWTAETMAPVGGAPTLGAETVYVHSSDQRVYAFDRASGDQQWATDVESGPISGATTASPGLTTGSLVTVTETGVVSLDAASGTERWSVASPGGPLAGSPIADPDIVVHQNGRRRVRGVDSETGEQVWETTVDERVLAGSQDAAAETFVLLTGTRGTTDCTLRILELSTGTERDTTALSINNEVTFPNYVRAVGDVVVTDVDGISVSAFTTASGERLWQRAHDTGVTPPLTVTDQMVYLKGFSEREVGEMAVDLQTGAERWALSLSGRGQCCQVAPAVGKLVYIARTGDAALVGVDESGQVRWRYTGSVDPTARPAVDAGALYVPSTDGRLYRIAI